MCHLDVGFLGGSSQSSRRTWSPRRRASLHFAPALYLSRRPPLAGHSAAVPCSFCPSAADHTPGTALLWPPRPLPSGVGVLLHVVPPPCPFTPPWPYRCRPQLVLPVRCRPRLRGGTSRSPAPVPVPSRAVRHPCTPFRLPAACRACPSCGIGALPSRLAPLPPSSPCTVAHSAPQAPQPLAPRIAALLHVHGTHGASLAPRHHSSLPRHVLARAVHAS